MVLQNVRPLTAAEIKGHPEYKHVIWPLEPTKSGKAQVGKGRGQPAEIYYECHGSGPILLVWITAFASTHTAWQPQTLHFSHTPENSTKYTSLVLDNRGIGKSSVPSMLYSTSIMAADVLDVLDSLGWTSPRSLHVLGISMGGMVAQELGLLIPDRIASLSLISTAARIVNTGGFFKNLRELINLFIPKPIDSQLVELKGRLFNPVWLMQPDDDVNFPCGGKFPTNGDRFTAQEITKRSNPAENRMKGIVLQAIATRRHYKSESQLKELGDRVGRERITVMHGTLDQMITFRHGEVLAKELEVELTTWQQAGHVLTMEKRRDFNMMVEQIVKKTERLSKSS